MRANKNEDRRVIADAYVNTMVLAVKGKKEDVEKYKGYLRNYNYALGGIVLGFIGMLAIYAGIVQVLQ